MNVWGDYDSLIAFIDSRIYYSVWLLVNQGEGQERNWEMAVGQPQMYKTKKATKCGIVKQSLEWLCAWDLRLDCCHGTGDNAVPLLGGFELEAWATKLATRKA
eukprot:EG_transcript_34323